MQKYPDETVDETSHVIA